MGFKKKPPDPPPIEDNQKRNVRGIVLLIFFFITITTLVLYGLIHRPQPTIPLSPTPLPEYVADTQAALADLEVERVRLDVQLEAVAADIATANEAERQRLLVEQLRLETERGDLSLRIDNKQADVDHKQALANISAQETATHLDAILITNDIEATRQFREVQVESDKATALRQQGIAWIVLVAIGIVVVGLGGAFTFFFVRWLIFIANNDHTHTNTPPPPEPKKPFELPSKNPETVPETHEKVSEVAEKLVRDFFDKLSTGEDPPSNWGRGVDDGYQIVKILDPSREPTERERAVIRYWHNQLGNKKSVTKLLYGHSNDKVYAFVCAAVNEHTEATV